MEINLGTPALLFPAISLLMLAYTNRFLGLASVVRQIHQTYVKTREPVYLRQIDNLRRRIKLIRDMQLCGVISLLLCTVCMFLIFRGWTGVAEIVFGASLVFMVLSLVLSLVEIHMSVHALDLQLKRIEEDETARENAP